jgi:uncharacterized membrane protein YhaH (DUF805 family)/cold shock CspA family protein
MKGEVLHYDDNSGAGYIAGDDGVRYTFTRADLKQLRAIGPGTKVDFDVDGRNATDIFIVDRPEPMRAYSGSPGNTQAYQGTVEPELGLFDYFKQCFSKKYASFYGRARRKEYWGFTLFTSLVAVALAAIIGLGVAMSSEALRRGEGLNIVAILGIVAFAVFAIACILPSIAVTVRRFHDIGQSGWIVLLFYVLAVVPYLNFVTSIIWLVMLCLNTQPQENKYGPPPKRFFTNG